jgi:hypothetical protein
MTRTLEHILLPQSGDVDDGSRDKQLLLVLLLLTNENDNQHHHHTYARQRRWTKSTAKEVE